MATSFKSTIVKTYPTVGEKTTRDTIYWKNFQFPITKKEYGAVTRVEFCPVEPYHYAITASTRVQIYGNRTNEPLKSFSKFQATAYSGSFRGDGKLLVAGGDEGTVRMFDTKSKSLLRMFRSQTGPVHVTRFMSDGLRIFSGSDDKTVCVWDIASQDQLHTFKDHQDYIRCGQPSQASKDIIITGSYDHTVKMYDTRTGVSVLSVDHGHPVESIVMFPHGSAFISAGGNAIKVWDVLSGGRLLTTLTNHHKTVMDLCFCNNYQRLASASLDRHVKIYDVTTYQVVHTLDYPSAILSLDIAPDDSTIAVGMADGLLSIQHRKPEDIPQPKKKKKASYRYVLKGKTYLPSKNDTVVEHKRREHIAKYDRFFKRFEHSKALDRAMEIRKRKSNPEVTVSILQELIRRDALRQALAGRDEKSLGSILLFIQKNISNPKFMATMVDVSEILLDIYAEQIGESSLVGEALQKLRDTVHQEVQYMKMLMEVMGSMDTLFAVAEHSYSSQTKNTSQVPVIAPESSS